MRWTLDPRQPGPGHLLLLLGLVLGVGEVPVFDQDEAAYAGFAHEMVRTGRWLLPEFLLSEIHRKPPLSTWLVAAAFQAFGESWWSLRLPAMLSFAGTCLLLATWGAPLFGAPRARRAAVLLGSSGALIFGRLAMTDGPLLLWETAAALALLRLMAGHGRAWALVLWGAVALALLTKGPAPVLMLGTMGGVLLLLHPERRRLWGCWPVLGLPLSLLPLLAWGALAWQVDGGETIRWMLDWYLLRRAGGAVLGQEGPPGTYALSFGLLLLPWAALLPAGLVDLGARVRRREPLALGLLAWLCGGWLIWELIPSKLPSYALGASPALALVMAGVLDGLDRKRPALWLGFALQGGVLLALAGALGWVGRVPGAGALAPQVLGLGLGLATLVGLGLLWRGRTGPGLGMLLLIAPVLLGSSAWTVFPALGSSLHPTWEVARRLVARTPPGTLVHVQTHWRLPSLPYHLLSRGLRVQLEPEPPQGPPAPGEAWISAEALSPAPSPPAPSSPAAASPLCLDEVAGLIPDKGLPTVFYIAWRPMPDAGAVGAGEPCEAWQAGP